MAAPSGRTNMQCGGMNCSFSRRDVIKLDDFLNDLSEELAPPRRFISLANQVLDELFDRLKVDSNSVYHDNFAIHIGLSVADLHSNILDLHLSRSNILQFLAV